MAVEDELRGGPMIEPKTRIFADQVCETASSLVESVRWLSSPPTLPLFFSLLLLLFCLLCVCGPSDCLALSLTCPRVWV